MTYQRYDPFRERPTVRQLPTTPGDSSNTVGNPFDAAVEEATQATSQLATFSRGGELTGLTLPYTGPHRLVFPINAALVSIRASVGTAPVGADIILDVLKNGTSLFPTSAKPTIVDGNNLSIAAIPDTLAITAGEYLQIQIEQVGSTTEGSDLTVVAEWRMAA